MPPSTRRILRLDELQLPSGSVLVLYEDLKEALRLVPKAVLLSPQEYQKLLDQLEQLKRQAKPDKPEVPSACRLKGRVENGLVYLQATFEFRTDRPGAMVALGCQRAWAMDAKLDGHLPWLRLGEEGYYVQVDKPGAHQASLDLVVPLVAKKGVNGADRGFDLDLPRAAITTLEQFDLPDGTTAVRMGNRAIRSLKPEPQRTRLENVPVASIDHLELGWKGPASEPDKGAPLLTATGRIHVQLNEARAIIDAELTLQVLRGETAQWRIGVPAGANVDVKPHPQDEARVQSIETSTETPEPVVTIKLKEPSPEPLRVTLHCDTARHGNVIAVSPFAVQGALTQKGDLDIRAPEDLRLRYRVGPELSPREVSEEQRRDGVKAAFTYWSLPASSKPKQPGDALLTIQAEPLKGAVETRVTHQLQLETDAEGRPRWWATAKIDVTPVRTAVDRLELSLPADYEYDKDSGPDPVDIVEDVVVDAQKRSLTFKLAAKQNGPFAVKMKGFYVPPLDQQKVSLELPRPLTWQVERVSPIDRTTAVPPAHPAVLDRGGQVTVKLSPGLEFAGRSADTSPAAVLRDASPLLVIPSPVKPGLQEYTWNEEKSPQRIELAWRSQRSELSVDSLIDITVADHQARVRQQLRFPQPASGQIVLDGPAGLREHVKITQGGEPGTDEGKTLDSWPVHLNGKAGQDCRLMLEYSVPLPEADSVADQDAAEPQQADAPLLAAKSRRLAIPLVEPALATRGEARIRLWSETGEQLRLDGGPWEELPTEIVPERDSLPSLVLRRSVPGSLSLQLTARGGALIASAVIERALIRAVIDAEGSQTCRARFLLAKLNARHLDIELPVAVSTTQVEVSLDGKGLRRQLHDEAGREVEIGKVCRVYVEPGLYDRPVVLSLVYRVGADRTHRYRPLPLTLHPPSLAGAVLLGRACWHLELPEGAIPLLASQNYALEQRWTWQGWLLTPCSGATSQELEQWLAGSGTLPTGEEYESGAVVWQSALAPLQLTVVSRRLWLLVCSLLLLGLGLGLWFSRSSAPLFACCLAVGALSLTVLALIWPAMLPAVVYGCEPGAATLLFVLGLQWVLHQRYRRRLIFMPGFTRLKVGSSLTAPGSGIRPRDPSTIDQPRKRGSSIVPGLPRSEG
jgi:hypothetical protein